MNHPEPCAEAPHQHSGVCVRAGYAIGRAKALDEVELAIAALILEIDDDDSYYTQGMQEGLAATRKVRADG